MAVRQYIGARYVPLYIGQWDATRTYEPLSIVTDGTGNSWTSRKVVPAGTPLQEGEFWAMTGVYSGQIMQIETRLQAAEEGVQDANENVIQLRSDVEAAIAQKRSNGRKFVLFGDSFAYGIQGGGRPWSADGWITAAKRLWGSDNVYAYDPATQTSITGTVGFTTDLSFETLLATAISVPDKSQITDVVLLAGTNDQNATAAQIETAVESFCNRVKQVFPNASIKIGVIGTAVAKKSNILNGYKSCVKYGAAFISDTYNLFCNPAYVNDGTHLTAEGYAFYLPYVLQAVLAGTVDFRFTFKYDLTLAAGLTVQTGRVANIVINVSNKGISFSMGDSDDANRAYYFLDVNLLGSATPKYTGYIAKNMVLPIVQDLGYDICGNIDLIISASNIANGAPFIYTNARMLLNINDKSLVFATGDGRVAPASSIAALYQRFYLSSGVGSGFIPWRV